MITFRKTLFCLAVLCIALLTSTEVHADTILVGSAGGPVYATANLRASQYVAGEAIWADTNIYSGATNVDTALLNGGANGEWQSIILSAISQGTTVYGSLRIGNAQTTPGSYSASFTAGMKVPDEPLYIVATEAIIGEPDQNALCESAYGPVYGIEGDYVARVTFTFYESQSAYEAGAAPINIQGRNVQISYIIDETTGQGSNGYVEVTPKNYQTPVLSGTSYVVPRDIARWKFGMTFGQQTTCSQGDYEFEKYQISNNSTYNSKIIHSSQYP